MGPLNLNTPSLRRERFSKKRERGGSLPPRWEKKEKGGISLGERHRLKPAPFSSRPAQGGKRRERGVDAFRPNQTGEKARKKKRTA